MLINIILIYTNIKIKEDITKMELQEETQKMDKNTISTNLTDNNNQSLIQPSLDYNDNNSEVNTTSCNKGKPYNKGELMSYTRQQRVQEIFSDMGNQINAEQNNQNKPKLVNKLVNLKNYFYNGDNKAFHLEIIKRMTKGNRNPKYMTPDDFTPILAEYLQRCYKDTKLPTLTRSYYFLLVLLCLLFNNGSINLNPLCMISLSLLLNIFMTLLFKLLLTGNVNPKLYSFLAENWWRNEVFLWQY